MMSVEIHAKHAWSARRWNKNLASVPPKNNQLFIPMKSWLSVVIVFSTDMAHPTQKPLGLPPSDGHRHPLPRS